MNTRKGRGRPKTKNDTPVKESVLTPSNSSTKKTLFTPCRRLGLGKKRTGQNSPISSQNASTITATPPVPVPAQQKPDVSLPPQASPGTSKATDEKPISSSSRRKKSSHPLKRSIDDSPEGKPTYTVLLSPVHKKRKLELVDIFNSEISQNLPENINNSDNLTNSCKSKVKSDYIKDIKPNNSSPKRDNKSVKLNTKRKNTATKVALPIEFEHKSTFSPLKALAKDIRSRKHNDKYAETVIKGTKSPRKKRVPDKTIGKEEKLLDLIKPNVKKSEILSPDTKIPKKKRGSDKTSENEENATETPSPNKRKPRKKKGVVKDIENDSLESCFENSSPDTKLPKQKSRKPDTIEKDNELCETSEQSTKNYIIMPDNPSKISRKKKGNAKLSVNDAKCSEIDDKVDEDINSLSPDAKHPKKKRLIAKKQEKDACELDEFEDETIENLIFEAKATKKKKLTNKTIDQQDEKTAELLESTNGISVTETKVSNDINAIDNIPETIEIISKPKPDFTNEDTRPIKKRKVREKFEDIEDIIPTTKTDTIPEATILNVEPKRISEDTPIEEPTESKTVMAKNKKKTKNTKTITSQEITIESNISSKQKVASSIITQIVNDFDDDFDDDFREATPRTKSKICIKNKTIVGASAKKSSRTKQKMDYSEFLSSEDSIECVQKKTTTEKASIKDKPDTIASDDEDFLLNRTSREDELEIRKSSLEVKYQSSDSEDSLPLIMRKANKTNKNNRKIVKITEELIKNLEVVSKNNSIENNNTNAKKTLDSLEKEEFIQRYESISDTIENSVDKPQIEDLEVSDTAKNDETQNVAPQTVIPNNEDTFCNKTQEVPNNYAVYDYCSDNEKISLFDLRNLRKKQEERSIIDYYDSSSNYTTPSFSPIEGIITREEQKDYVIESYEDMATQSADDEVDTRKDEEIAETTSMLETTQDVAPEVETINNKIETIDINDEILHTKDLTKDIKRLDDNLEIIKLPEETIDRDVNKTKLYENILDLDAEVMKINQNNKKTEENILEKIEKSIILRHKNKELIDLEIHMITSPILDETVESMSEKADIPSDNQTAITQEHKIENMDATELVSENINKNVCLLELTNDLCEESAIISNDTIIKIVENPENISKEAEEIAEKNMLSAKMECTEKYAEISSESEIEKSVEIIKTTKITETGRNMEKIDSENGLEATLNLPNVINEESEIRFYEEFNTTNVTIEKPPEIIKTLVNDDLQSTDRKIHDEDSPSVESFEIVNQLTLKIRKNNQLSLKNSIGVNMQPQIFIVPLDLQKDQQRIEIKHISTKNNDKIYKMEQNKRINGEKTIELQKINDNTYRVLETFEYETQNDKNVSEKQMEELKEEKIFSTVKTRKKRGTQLRSAIVDNQELFQNILESPNSLNDPKNNTGTFEIRNDSKKETNLIISKIEALNDDDFDFAQKIINKPANNNKKSSDGEQESNAMEESVFFTPPSSRSENDSDCNRNDFQTESESSPNSNKNPFGEGTSKSITLKNLSVSNLTEIIGIPPSKPPRILSPKMMDSGYDLRKEEKRSKEDQEVEEIVPKVPNKITARGRKRKTSRSNLSSGSRKSNVTNEKIVFDTDSDDDFQSPRLPTQKTIKREVVKEEIGKKTKIKPVLKKSIDILNRSELFRITKSSTITALHKGQVIAYIKSHDNKMNMEKIERDNKKKLEKKDVEKSEIIENIKPKSMITEHCRYKSNERIPTMFDFVIDDPDAYLKSQEMSSKPNGNEELTRTDIKKQILDTELRIKEKQAKLERLKLISVYKRAHDLDQLQRDTSRMRKGCQEALLELAAVLRQTSYTPFDMATLLHNMHIPNEIVGYNVELDEFT